MCAWQQINKLTGHAERATTNEPPFFKRGSGSLFLSGTNSLKIKYSLVFFHKVSVLERFLFGHG